MAFIKRKASAMGLSAAVVIGSGLLVPPAQAAYIVDLTQMGNNVVASGSGTINLTGLTRGSTFSTGSVIHPSIAEIVTGPSGTIDTYTGLTGPASFGPGGTTIASSGTGVLVGVTSIVTTAASISSAAALVAAELAVPSGYMSGGPLSDTSTYLNQTLASLGATPGTYTWSWNTPGVSVSSASDDTFTLVISAATVPEPSTVAQFGVGIAGLVLAGMYRRRRHWGSAP